MLLVAVRAAGRQLALMFDPGHRLCLLRLEVKASGYLQGWAKAAVEAEFRASRGPDLRLSTPISWLRSLKSCRPCLCGDRLSLPSRRPPDLSTPTAMTTNNNDHDRSLDLLPISAAGDQAFADAAR